LTLLGRQSSFAEKNEGEKEARSMVMDPMVP
jgi:hypothetical protein